ncbi:MAG: IPT/TIG domain-containing protein, partial [Methanoregula sp.]
MGRYDANLVGSKLHSATGKAPAVSMTIGTARTYAENKGAGWGITNVWTLSGLRQLFYTEMVTLNSQAAWTGSRGWVDANTGPTISGNESIDTAIYAINATGNGTGKNGQTPVSYRGIENLWGNVFQIQDGFNAITTNTNVINATGLGLTGQKTRFKDVLDANDVQSVGALVLTDGYQTNLLNTDVARSLFLPSAVGGSEITYTSDYYYYPHSTNPSQPNVLYSGVIYSTAGRSGIGGLDAGGSAWISVVTVGARLEFRRSPAPVVSFSSTNTSVATNTTSQGWAGTAPFTMVFNDTSTNYPAGWAWGRNNLTVTAWERFSTTNNATQTFVAGNWSVNVTAINSGGAGVSGITWVNVSETSPSITVISPDSGPLAAGTLVNITGTNLAGVTSVTFGSAAATINTNTVTTINMTAPGGSVGPVTVTVITPNGTATTSYTYTGDPIEGVIGFRWNTSDSSPRLYQIDSDGTVIPNATGDWFNTHLPWSGMKTVVVNASNTTPVLYGTNNRGDGLDLSGTYGDVMVEIPIFYTCSTYANGNFSYWISPTAQDELHYTVAPMFNQRGTGTDAGTPAPYYYVGRYDANLVGTKLQSATGKAPAVSMTIGTARTYAENKGAGWGITNVWTLSGLRQLFYTEMVTLNSQAAWTGSRGWVDANTGPTISGNESIDTAIYAINATGNGTGKNGQTPVSYRGIENLWGNVFQIQDGFNAITTNTNVINATGLGLTGQKTRFKDVLDANDVQSVGALVLTDGYQTNLLNTDVARSLFLPSAVGGSEITYTSDYYYYPHSTNPSQPNVLYSGVIYSTAGRSGIGGLDAGGSAWVSVVTVGARLEFRRSLAPVASFSSTNTSVATNTTSQGWAGTAPFTMVFNDTSTNVPTSWKWGRNNLTVAAWEQFSTTNNATQTFVAGNWSVNLTVINSGGSGISGITWVNVSESTPTITVISPASSPLAAGTLVNITGTNLAGATSVTFGSAAATINTNTATTINMTAPAASAGAGPVTVTVTTPAGTATTSYTYTGDPIEGVIGFRWNTSDPSPRLYQIDSDGTVIPNATGDWFNTHLPWSGMKTVVVNASNATPVLYGTNNRGDGLDLSGTYGDVMIEIPIFYTCSTYANGNFSYWISPGAQDELHYTVAPMFNQRGVGTDAGTPASHFYVGRYDANLVGTKLQSATGKAPAVSMTIGTARTYAENKGAGWGITNVWTLSGLRQLFYTEMVSLNSQTAWTGSRGVVDFALAGPAVNSGADGIDAAIYTINATGSGTGLYGKTPVSYRGIENLWGNVWQFQDGFNALKTPGTTNVINATGLGLTGQKTTFKDLLDENDRQSVGALPTTDNAGSYQTNLLNPDIARPVFLPSAVGGSATTYLSDKIWSPTSSNTATPNILFSGGAWYDAGDAGVGSLV